MVPRESCRHRSDATAVPRYSGRLLLDKEGRQRYLGIHGEHTSPGVGGSIDLNPFRSKSRLQARRQLYHGNSFIFNRLINLALARISERNVPPFGLGRVFSEERLRRRISHAMHVAVLEYKHKPRRDIMDRAPVPFQFAETSKSRKKIDSLIAINHHYNYIETGIFSGAVK